MTAYYIAPLQWRFEDGLWRADSIFGQFFAHVKSETEVNWALAGNLYTRCTSLDDVKELADKMNRSRLLPALVPVPDGAQVVGVAYNPNPEGRT